MDDITLVIPAKNEAESLPYVLDELLKYKIKKIIVIPIEDKNTRKAIEKFNCKILSQEGKGFGNALIQGINSVETKYFCIFNADGSFDPIYLSQLRNKIQLDQDFVFSSRYEQFIPCTLHSLTRSDDCRQNSSLSSEPTATITGPLKLNLKRAGLKLRTSSLLKLSISCM